MSYRQGSGLRGAVAFLTSFGGAAGANPQAMGWFPAVGAALGLVFGAWWWLTAHAWPTPVAAALVVAADLGLTGMLHFDGLLDSADGLLSHLPRQRRLEVMAEPGIGAFAMAVGASVLLARWASVWSLAPAPLLIAALWCGSRTLMAAVVRTQPYARVEGGLAAAFVGDRHVAPLVIGGLSSLALAAAWRPVAGPLAAVSGGLAGAGVVMLGRRQLGGFTGDVLGAAGVISETVGLIVAAAKW